ncbi:HTH-type transcriptional activator IlvY [Aliiglaciecola sp. CAU 1673]|uniref:HTH-type transcriptional activator IlvY n=1 Tax=Aliiglaciecola sp. CAU 1673 TaxID=3032595 RepID=UPI0023DA75A8|nr:HTH-type transcriptional activator IlvY [Aliiglaciecola sp. CAU 1673]MDF2179087.1 HTH-type transcriptional activator IlvY [Aliiglaciecola sp. CAU 1673]
MDIRTLQLFQHLADSLHFAKTAEAMHVSPPTLSRAIQRLEEDCGAALFVRDNRSVKLTAAGAKLLAFSAQTLEDWQRLKSELKQDSQLLKGELSLFCSVTASYSHLPALLERFRQAYPQVEIRLTTGDPALATSKVINQEADLAIAAGTPDFPTELSFHQLDVLPFVLICPAGYRLSQWQQLDWRTVPMVLPESGPSKRIVHHWLTEHGIRPKVYASVTGHEAIVSMVALGCGVGIVPKAVVEHSIVANRITMLPLEGIESFKLGLCCLKGRSNEPLVRALLDQV